MTTTNLGNDINRIVRGAFGSLIDQSELVQLTFGAFDIAFQKVNSDPQEQIQLTFPIGWSADNVPMHHTKTYSKQELLSRYRFLGFNQLAINAIVQLVTIVEAMCNDLLRAIVAKYPGKLGANRKLSLGAVLASSSIEVVHGHAIDTLLNELAYKSPKEYAEAVQELIGINLMECTAFQKYVEIKATRDVYIHNSGVANDIYARKADVHARVKPKNKLPVGLQYFLASFEQCAQLTEWLEQQLHEKWHSSDFAQREEDQKAERTPEPLAGDAVSEQLKQLAVKQAQTPKS